MASRRCVRNKNENVTPRNSTRTVLVWYIIDPTIDGSRMMPQFGSTYVIVSDGNAGVACTHAEKHLAIVFLGYDACGYAISTPRIEEIRKIRISHRRPPNLQL